MDSKKQKYCIFLGYGFLVLYLIGFIGFAHFIPATPPSWNAVEVANMYDSNRFGILFGMLLCVIASPLLASWSIAVFAQMRRIETGTPILSYTQLINGALLSIYFMLPPIIWATAAYRSVHSPETILIMNDLGWIGWLISWPYAFFQQIALAICGLMEKSEKPVFPRWVCYLSLWTSVTMVPVGVVLFVYHGPFAWNGLFGLYLAAGVYVCYYTAVTVSVSKAIDRQTLAGSAIPALG